MTGIISPIVLTGVKLIVYFNPFAPCRARLLHDPVAMVDGISIYLPRGVAFTYFICFDNYYPLPH